MAEEKQKAKKRKTSRKWLQYDAKSGDPKLGLKRKNPFCPKCGAGVFLGSHPNRFTCGSCGYVEVKTDKK